MTRKMESKRDAEWRALDARALPELLERIAGAGTLAEAFGILDQAPGVDAPGRRHYANLGWLLTSLGVPRDATPDELVAYVGMVERIMQMGALGGGVGDELLVKLCAAVATK